MDPNGAASVPIFSAPLLPTIFVKARISVPEIIHSKKTAVILHTLEVEMRAALSGVSIKAEKSVEGAAGDWIRCHECGGA